MARWGYDVPFDIDKATHLEVIMTYNAITYFRKEEQKANERDLSEAKREAESIKRMKRY